MSTGHIKSDHYSNYLLVSKEGNPLSTINRERFDWYLKRGLGEEIEWADKRYPKVMKINFQHKGEDSKRNSDILPVETRCVICGATDTLSLHHVVPHRVKKFYPAKQKNHTKHLCVLMCEKHHMEIEIINDELISNPAKEFQKIKLKLLRPIEAVIDVFRKIHMRYWIWKHGGIPKINKIFTDRFLKMNPKYLPKEWL